MNIFIWLECEPKFTVKIDKYMTVSRLYDFLPRKSIDDNYKFSAIYEEIVLNDDKLIAFYNICENDIIWIGKLDKYLNSSHVIVEIFLVRFFPETIYLIANKNDTFDKIKSILRKFISNIDSFDISDIRGNSLKDEMSVESIFTDGKYQKIILNDKIDKYNFSGCCSLHDKYFMNEYFCDYHWNFWMIFEINSIPRHIIFEIKTLKESIQTNEFIDPIIYKNLSEIPISLQNSSFLFIKNISNDIINCLKILYAQNHSDISTYDFRSNLFVYDYIIIALQYSLFLYVTKQKGTDKLIRDIIIEACDLLTEPEGNFRNIMKSLLGHFLINNIPEKFDDIIKKRWRPYLHISLKLGNNINRRILNFLEMETVVEAKKITSMEMETVVEAKKSTSTEMVTVVKAKKITSMETNVPVNQLYCIKTGRDEQPNDSDSFDDFFIIEIVSSMDDIQLLKQIGKGAFSKVILCQNKLTSSVFVLKIPLNKRTDLYRDISILSRMKYSRIVNNYNGLFTYSGKICMAMEYLSGGSLTEHQNRGLFFTEEKIAKICYQILLQIKEIHSLGIIHRDIKCDNIILDQKGNAKLIDFGISKFINNPLADITIPVKPYRPGTMYYMAPELINGEPYNNKIDIWSFGVAVIEMITGNRPYPLMGPFQAAIKIASERKILFKPIDPISDELKDFISFCLKADPKERLSAHELNLSRFIERVIISNIN